MKERKPLFIGLYSFRSVSLKLCVEGREVTTFLSERGQFPFGIQAAVRILKGVFQDREQVLYVSQDDLVSPHVWVDLVVGEAGEKGDSVPEAGLRAVDREGIKTNLIKKFSKFIAFFSKLFRFREL